MGTSVCRYAARQPLGWGRSGAVAGVWLGLMESGRSDRRTAQPERAPTVLHSRSRPGPGTAARDAYDVGGHARLRLPADTRFASRCAGQPAAGAIRGAGVGSDSEMNV